jgi:hypothetical protein
MLMILEFLKQHLRFDLQRTGFVALHRTQRHVATRPGSKRSNAPQVRATERGATGWVGALAGARRRCGVWPDSWGAEHAEIPVA